MSRRVKFGCMGAVLLVLASLGGWTYFSIIRPAQDIMDDIDLMADLAFYNEHIVNQEPYTPPQNGELTEVQLEKFSRIQEKMKSGLDDSYSLLHERALMVTGLFRKRDGERELRNVGYREVITAFDGLGAVLTLAKKIQISGLNEEGFSQAEYRWVRERFYHAMGFSRFNIYLEDFAASMKDENDQEAIEDFAEKDVDSDPLPHNKDLSSLYSNEANSWNPFREFGL